MSSFEEDTLRGSTRRKCTPAPRRRRSEYSNGSDAQLRRDGGVARTPEMQATDARGQSSIPTWEDVAQASERIRPVVRETPIFPLPPLGGGPRIALKLECFQRSGSF